MASSQCPLHAEVWAPRGASQINYWERREWQPHRPRINETPSVKTGASASGRVTVSRTRALRRLSQLIHAPNTVLLFDMLQFRWMSSLHSLNLVPNKVSRFALSSNKQKQTHTNTARHDLQKIARELCTDEQSWKFRPKCLHLKNLLKHVINLR